MPLGVDRTWYNTLIDDDSTGTTGTVFDKAAVDGLLDSVDLTLNAIKLDQWQAPTDVLTNNVSLAAHGLAPKLTGDLTSFLRADGLWAAVNPAVIGITALGGYAGGTATYLRADATFATPKLDDLAAPDDNTDLNVSTAAHGLAPKLPNDATKFLNGVGAYAVPPTTPSAHHTSHESGGSDAIKLDDLAAPDDNTDLDASTTKHGLLKKLPGGTTSYLRGDGVFATPPGGGGSGTVTGPATSVVGRVPTWADAFGTVLADGGVLLSNIVVTSDSRLSDARPPTAHAASHRSGGSDALVFNQTTSATGTQNNFSLNGPNTVLECSGAAPVFTGFTVAGSAPVGGDRAVLIYTGSGTLRVPKEDTGSTAANRITAPSARGQIVGVGGTITLVYSGATSRWLVVAVEPGAPIAVAYTAGDFTADVGTWTVDAGDVTTFTYQQNGPVITVVVTLLTTSVSGSPTYLRILIPNGFTISKFIVAPAAGNDGGTGRAVNALVYSVLSTTLMHFNLVAGGTWAAAANNTNLFAVFTFEVN